ncbi:hypothetical protein AMATHDRAFT_157441, partial [Amanita thiersii Skay4041]
LTYFISNGCQTVGDGAASINNETNTVAVCEVQGAGNLYYYSTAFSGGPGVWSSGCVTGNPTPLWPRQNDISSPLASCPRSNFTSNSIVTETQPHCVFCRHPQPRSSNLTTLANHLSRSSTPSLTPDSSDDSNTFSPNHRKDALDFLMMLFPGQGLFILPHSRSISITINSFGAAFDGFVLDLPGSFKTLYVDGKRAESVNLRESIVALLDLAAERLGCSGVVIALERSSPSLALLLHSLMYVGGTVVTKPPFEVDSAFVLVGLEV